MISTDFFHNGVLLHIVLSDCQVLSRQRASAAEADPWDIISLGCKEPELVQEVEHYKLDLMGPSSTHSYGSIVLDGG